MELPNSLQCPDFSQTNSLIYRRSTSHQIINLTLPQKNVQLKFIIILKQPTFNTKKDAITQCYIADETASMAMNFYNQSGQQVQQGDIFYISGAYTSFYKGMIILYQGQSILKRLGKWYMKYNPSKNISLQSLQNKQKQKQKIEEQAFKLQKLVNDTKFKQFDK